MVVSFFKVGMVMVSFVLFLLGNHLNIRDKETCFHGIEHIGAKIPQLQT